MATVTAAQMGRGAQTIEGFVGAALDDAKISPLHRRVIGLIAAGYFFDVIDFTVFGSLVPYILQVQVSRPDAEVAAIGSATVFGMFVGTAGQGEFTDRFGRRFIYQFNLLLFGIFTILGAFAPSVTLLIICRFIAGIGLGAEQPLAFAYAGEYSPKRIRGRILAIVHFIGGACVWPIGTALVLGFSAPLRLRAGAPENVWRGVWVIVGIGALIVWVLRFSLPESPRYLATHGSGDEAIKVLGRLGIAGPTQPLSTDAASNTKSDPFAVVFSQFPVRVIAGMICFTAFFGVAIGLGAWLPNIMNAKGFSITKSLQYTLAMNFAVPCASIFMMYALDKFGRKITSVCTFVAAGLMAIVFANAVTAVELMVAGFIMIFFVQVAGNSMQIFASEVFPTNARTSGFGWAAGVGRLATAFIMPTILWVQNGYGLTTVFVSLGDPALDRGRVGDPVGPRGAAEEPRRDRAADGVKTSSPAKAGEESLLTANCRRSAGCACRLLRARWSPSRRRCGTPGRRRTACPAPPRRPRLPEAR